VPFFLDRETGKPVLPVEERPVKQDAFLKTSPTQPFTAGADRVGPACVDKSMIPPGFEAGCYFDPIRVDMPNHYMPHMNMRQTPMAYSPATGYLYASVCVNPAWIRRAETPWAFVRPTRLPGQQQHGFMTAIDARTGKTVWNKRVAYAGCEGGGGATATAGGLVFHVEPDGNFQAYSAKTGDVVWQFQTGDVGFGGGAGPGGGPAVTYESGGEQYVALTMNHVVWAFKRGGTLTPRPAIAPPPTTLEWEGRVEDTAAIQLGTVSTFTIASAGRKEEWANDYGVSPPRVRAKAGAAVTWTNTSRVPHTLAARDGSWSTGSIKPGESASVTIGKAGSYEYTCKEHPWTIGQLIVQ
jgi:plastocyanin